MDDKNIMKLGAYEAFVTMNQNIGGPFGAVVVMDGKIISVASNSVLQDNDPTAHAEINAIRKACKKLGTYDLTGCQLYATGYPCPMCLSAIIWANIKTVYYCNDVKEAEKIGFRDDLIYDFIRGHKDGILEIHELKVDECGSLYENYASMSKIIY